MLVFIYPRCKKEYGERVNTTDIGHERRAWPRRRRDLVERLHSRPLRPRPPPSAHPPPLRITGNDSNIAGFVMPRYYDVFVPAHRRAEGTEPTVACETKVIGGDEPVVGRGDDSGEAGIVDPYSPDKEPATVVK